MKRRTALQLSTLLGMNLTGPPVHSASKAVVTSVEMLTMSHYMAGAAKRRLPAQALEQAKFHILDTFASMISGSALPPGEAALRYLKTHVGKGAASIVGARLEAGPVDAALVNGVMGHANETDDSHGRAMVRWLN